MKKMLLMCFLFVVACSPKKELVDVISGRDGLNGTDGKNGHSIVSMYDKVNSYECDEMGGSRLDLYLDMDDSLSVSEGDLFQGSLVACNGLNGLQGIQGLQGVKGDKGDTGETGAQGIPGEQGPQGVAGATGAQGLPGPQGLTGATGPQGLTGAVGPQGVPGMPGPMGPQGPQGPQGLTGAQGAPGAGATITVYANNSSCVSIAGSTYYVKSGDIYDNNTCSSSHKVAVLQGGGDSFWVATRMLATDNNNSGLRVITFN